MRNLSRNQNPENPCYDCVGGGDLLKQDYERFLESVNFETYTISRVQPFEINNKQAFTLAEVLITLGIIGIVAALTIPTLLVNNKARLAQTRLRKMLSTLNNAVKMAKAKYDVDFANVGATKITVDMGSYTYDGYSMTVCNDPETDNLDSGNTTICGIFNSTLTGLSYEGLATEQSGWMLYPNGKKFNTDSSPFHTYGPYAVYTLPSGGTLMVSTQNTNDSTLELKGCTKNNFLNEEWDFGPCLGWIDLDGMNSAKNNAIGSMVYDHYIEDATDTDFSWGLKNMESQAVDKKNIPDIHAVLFVDDSVLMIHSGTKGIFDGKWR